MKNIVYIIVIIFWILSLYSKSKKKQQIAAERKNIDALNKRVSQRTETEKISPAPKKRTPEEILGLFQARQNQAPVEAATDYELAYASNDYAQDEKKNPDGLKSVPLKRDTASHYEKNYGMAKSLGTESAEEKEAYDKDIAIIPRLSLTSGGIKQYIIASEILGKPRALRGRGSGSRVS